MSKTITYTQFDNQILNRTDFNQYTSNSINLEKLKSSFYGECYSGNFKGIKSLIDHNREFVDFTKGINSVETLFYIINGNGSSEDKESVMSYLKEEKLLDLNINNGYALEIAVQKDDISLVNFLMDNGVKMNSYEDGILLYYAAQKNNYDMFFLLKDSGIDLDQDLLKDIKGLELSGDIKVAIDHFDS